MIEDTRALAARLIAASPLAIPLEEALKQKRERRAALLATPPPPEPDVSPEPLPIIDQPDKFARDFWKTREPKDVKLDGKRSRTKRDSPPQQRGPFRVIRGDLDGDKPQ